MTDHLPECHFGCTCDQCPGNPCICDRLRACEQRVRDESWDHGMEVGTHSALDAAREAVERVSTLFEPLGPALAAIDGLREKP